METKIVSELFASVLKSKFSASEIDFMLKWYLEVNTDVNNVEKINKDLADLLDDKPLQYVLGISSFYGYSFYVDSSTLIPRPETEELVEWILSDFSKNKVDKLNIIDLGTGTGCIPITLKLKQPNCNVEGIDIQENAIKIAQKNAKYHQIEATFYRFDILNDQLKKNYDIIISNPPYIRELEKTDMSDNVLNFEPLVALFVSDQNPLIFYQKIAELAYNNLNENGYLYLEINQYLGTETLDLVQNFFEMVELKKDISGNDRMIKAWQKKSQF